jgi:N-methylhydantoinase A
MHDEAQAVVAPAAKSAGIATTGLRVERLAEIRYEGQGHELRVKVPDGPLGAAQIAQLRADFEAAYERSFGLRIPGAEVEVVTWSLTVATPGADSRAAGVPETPLAAQPSGRRAVWDPGQGRSIDFDVHWRFDLPRGTRIDGPALIVEHETSTVVPPRWRAHVDSALHLRLEQQDNR